MGARTGQRLRDQMNKEQIREILAQEMERGGEKRLAAAIREGSDNSIGGTAALAACIRVRDWAVGEGKEALDRIKE